MRRSIACLALGRLHPGAAVLLAAAALAAFAGPAARADARLSWCLGDPVVEIAGEEVDINVLVPMEHLDALQNPVVVEIHVPAGVPHRLVEMNSPYFEEAVTFVEEPGWSWEAGKPTRVEARVLVNATGDFRVKVEVTFAREDGHERALSRGGRANRWVEAAFRLGK